MDAPIPPNHPDHPQTSRQHPLDSAHRAPSPSDADARDRSFSARLSGHASRAPDPFDALADLFLGPAAGQGRAPEATSPPPLRLVQRAEEHAPSDAPERLIEPKRAPAQPAHAAPASIEGIILGHLPVFASAWATQYAKQAAQASSEPVALLRFTGGRATLDVYGSRSDAPRFEDLPGAIAHAASIASRWIVRLPDACEPELAEGGTDIITLLTGADEAAVVACYRTLKNLSGAERLPDAGDPSWRVAIMGADAIKAADAAKRVERAASAFLESPLEVAPCVARIGALRSSLAFDGPTTLSWRQSISLIRSAPTSPRSTPPSGPFRPDTRSPSPSDTPAQPRVEVRPIAAAPDRITPRSVTPPTPRQTGADVSTRSEPPGWIPGLSPSDVRCPSAPSIEFATDREGTLHLIARDGTERSVRALLTASSWATQHAALLRMADQRIGSVEQPVMHVLTTTPASERFLLDTPLRVHAVARVGDAWTLLDLN